MNQYFQKAVHTTTAFLPHLLSAIITLVVGFIIIRLFRKFMMRLIEKKRFDATLLKFVMDVAVWTMRALLFVSIITKLGVETSAFVAAIGAAGLAIGLSLQGSLSNFAGGLLIILLNRYVLVIMLKPGEKQEQWLQFLFLAQKSLPETINPSTFQTEPCLMELSETFQRKSYAVPKLR
ncbi:mechanosensitive ion channel [Flavobacterium lindanitolerans]|nr:mechanosensitive ion channel [Flavobacterium lindanitolerans]